MNDEKNVPQQTSTREIDNLHQHVNRMLQVIGLIGGAITIVVPLVALFAGIRSDASIDRRLTEAYRVVDTKIEALESRIGIARGAPSLSVMTRNGEILKGKTIEAHIVKTYLEDEKSDSPSCVNESDKLFDEYAVQIPVLIKNEGTATANIDVIRILHEEIFSDLETILIKGKSRSIAEWNRDNLSPAYFPGKGYTTPYYLPITSGTPAGTWCSPEDFSSIVDKEKLASIEVYYHDAKGSSLLETVDFRVKLSFED